MINFDNEEYFKRKAVLKNQDDKFFDDNDERAIFFAKGVIETVKKLNWAPDIIHVHGWLASLFPLYLRQYYSEEPLFENSKIVTSVYNTGFDGALDSSMVDKVKFDGIEGPALEDLFEADYNSIMKVAIDHSDAAIIGSEEIPQELEDYLKKWDKPVLNFHNKEAFSEAYLDFYTSKVL